MVYIRIEADISALTYPNKRQAVCYPASTGGGAAGGGDRGGRKREKGGSISRQERGGVSLQCIFPSLPQSQRGKTPVSI